MTVTYTPALPVAGDTVSLAYSPTPVTAATDVAFAIASVPNGSSYAIGPLVDLDGKPSSEFVPDIGGEFGFEVVGQYAFDAPPAFAGDPSGQLRTAFDVLDTASVSVGELVSLPIAAGPDSLRLTLGIYGDAVGTATLDEASTDVARVVSLLPAVQIATAALLGTVVPAMGDDLILQSAELRGAYENHRSNLPTDYHATGGVPLPDTTNVCERFAPESVDAAIALVGELSNRLTQHLAQIPPAVPVLTRWHPDDDTRNGPVSPFDGTLAGATVHLADLRYRVFERHRVMTSPPPIHAIADTDNALSAPSPLAVLIVAILEGFAAQAITAPAGEQQGRLDAETRFGFV
ncbi:MAG: hypothetical protein CL484_00270 [Acidobacteria bacterium]|nr:hypothetical protein [Acidobacteriota bacterium]